MRLFLAAEPPPHVRDTLADLMEGVPGARWADVDTLHLTLGFLGEVDRPTAEDLHLALASLRHPRIDAALGPAGVFTARGRPATLWIAVEPREALTRLHKKLDAAATSAGLPPERRAYHPHVTLARLSPGASPQSVITAAGRLPRIVFAIDAVTLFESRLGRTGAHHEPLVRYALG